MHRTTRRLGALVGAVGLLTALTVGSVSAGGDTTTTASTVAATNPPSTFALPFMGAPLSLTVTTGPGGNLADISIDPATGFTPTKVSPRAVVFTNADGTVKLVVKSKGNQQRVEARAGALADISGPGWWEGDVFNTGVLTRVDYTVGGTDAAPTVNIDLVSDPTATIGEVQTESEAGEASAKQSVTFVLGGQSRTLTIKVEVEADDDDDDDADDSDESSSSVEGTGVEAKLRISLSRLRGVEQAIADAQGPQAWSALLCDGSTATVTYVVNPDGSLSDVVVSPDADRVRTEGDRIEVRWGDKERVKIRARVDGDQILIDIEEKIRCRDADDPTINGSAVSTTDDDADDDDDDDDDGDHSGHGGGDDDEHDEDEDD